MAKKKTEISFVQLMRKFNRAGIEGSPPPNRIGNNYDEIPSLELRIEKLLGLVNRNDRPASNMIFFVMYDIEDNKVRTHIAKYLLRQGCTRVQRSIFLADLPNNKYESIRSDLTEVQAAYENNDSILIVPISTDYLTAMRVIGQTIEMDIITHKRNTLFF